MNSDSAANAAAAGIFGGMMLFGIIVLIAITVFYVWLFWRVFARTGMNGALGLICLIPIGPLICMLILAFSRWPLEDQLAYAGAVPPHPQPPATELPPPEPPGTSVMPT